MATGKFENKKQKKLSFSKIAFPGWLFVLLMTLYSEWMLLFSSGNTLTVYRIAVVTLFAGGFGSILAMIVSFFRSPRAEKCAAILVSLLPAILCMVEFYICDAYQTFMDLKTMLAGAGGVATGFGDVVVSLIVRGIWRIALMLLPILLYGFFTSAKRAVWHTRAAIAGISVVCYALAALCIWHDPSDKLMLGDNYSFDGAVRSFGLNVAFALDAFGGTDGENNELDFDIPDYTLPQQTTESTTQQTQPSETEAVTEGETEPTETEPIVYGDNVMDVDFAALAENCDRKSIASLHSYIASQEPSKKNEYTGLFAGKNLILITAEAFSAEVIDPVLTPTLYRLATQGIRFTEYYQPLWGGSTSTGEYSVLTGMVAANSILSVKEAIQQDLFFTMGNQLQDQGYFSAAYHNNSYTYYDRHQTHTYFGYDTYMGMGNGMEEGVEQVWPESDLEMIDFTCPQYIDHQPFSIYYMTVSGHANYNNYGGNAMTTKNFHLVEDLDYSDTVKSYLACNLELEHAMASLVSQLEKAGILDDTVIVISPDHYPYALEKSSTWNNSEDYLTELRGSKYTNEVERDRTALIIWSGCIEGMDLCIDTPTYSLDILPTLSNLFGLTYESRMMIGRDVFSDQLSLALWPDFSWKTEKGTYIFATNTFTPAEGVEVDEDYVDYISTIVKNKIVFSRATQEYDYFNVLLDAIGQTE